MSETLAHLASHKLTRSLSPGGEEGPRGGGSPGAGCLWAFLFLCGCTSAATEGSLPPQRAAVSKMGQFLALFACFLLGDWRPGQG